MRMSKALFCRCSLLSQYGFGCFACALGLVACKSGTEPLEHSVFNIASVVPNQVYFFYKHYNSALIASAK